MAKARTGISDWRTPGKVENFPNQIYRVEKADHISVGDRVAILTQTRRPGKFQYQQAPENYEGMNITHRLTKVEAADNKQEIVKRYKSAVEEIALLEKERDALKIASEASSSSLRGPEDGSGVQPPTPPVKGAAGGI